MNRVILASMLLLASAGVDKGFACSCPDIAPPFEHTARESQMVVFGRVSRVRTSVPGWHSFDRKDPSPVYVDVDVERVLKGSLGSKHLRIWDQHYGSSCEGSLVQLSAGSLVIVTPRGVTAEEARDAGHHRNMGWWMPPLGAGQFVFEICRQNFVLLKSEREADEWAKRLR